MTTASPLPDVQASLDTRQLAIQKVGVKAIRYPVQIQLAQGVQSSVALIEMTVALPPEVKGTHMSRFLEILEANELPLSFEMLQSLMQKMLVRLEANAGDIIIKLPIFLKKTAPVSGVESLLDYDLAWHVSHKNGVTKTELKVVAPVTSLCPCSKKISEYGAHNQRSHITIAAQLNKALSAESLIRAAEESASCELWGLLKRPDEKYVTERAYDNPKFVEDLVRDVAMGVKALDAVQAFSIESENFESIHNHSAYAVIEWQR